MIVPSMLSLWGIIPFLGNSDGAMTSCLVGFLWKVFRNDMLKMADKIRKEIKSVEIIMRMQSR